MHSLCIRGAITLHRGMIQTCNQYEKLLTCIRTRLGLYPIYTSSWNRSVVVQYSVAVVIIVPVEMTAVSHLYTPNSTDLQAQTFTSYKLLPVRTHEDDMRQGNRREHKEIKRPRYIYWQSKQQQQPNQAGRTLPVLH